MRSTLMRHRTASAAAWRIAGLVGITVALAQRGEVPAWRGAAGAAGLAGRSQALTPAARSVRQHGLYGRPPPPDNDSNIPDLP